MTETSQPPIVGARFASALSLSDDLPTVILTGEADIAAVDALEATLAAAADLCPKSDVHVDAAGLTFLGATVIDTLVAADRRLRADGRRLFVVNAGPRVARVLGILQLESLIGTAR